MVTGPDYSTSQQEGKEEVQSPSRPTAVSMANPPRRPTTVGRRKTFPLRLHSLLDEVEMTGQTHIISWQPHGRCFVVHDTAAFVKQLLPRYFNHTKWSSFQRQLNLYSFERISTGIDRGGYYHKYFLRGEPALSHSIVRTKVKGTKCRVSSDIRNQPNFYLEPSVNPPAPSLEEMGLTGGLGRFMNSSIDALLPSMIGRPSAPAARLPSSNPSDALLLQSLAGPDPDILPRPREYSANQAVLMNQAGLLPASVPDASIRERARQLIGVTDPAATSPFLSREPTRNWNLLAGPTLSSTLGVHPQHNVARMPDPSSLLPDMSHSLAYQQHRTTIPNRTTPTFDYDSKPPATERPSRRDADNAAAPGHARETRTNTGDGNIQVLPQGQDASAHQSSLDSTVARRSSERDAVNVSESAGENQSQSGGLDEASEWGRFLNRYFD